MTGIVVLGGVTSGMAATKSSAVSSEICSKWGDGYFFNYAMTGKGDLSSYQSSYTCSAVAKAGAPVTYDGGCACRCTNPTQVFDPAAAEQCAQKGDATVCGSVCADIRRTVQCSAEQRPYYINDTWQCCIFYDPMSKTCITDTATWKNFLAQTMNMSGGYVAADGLPTECPDGTTADETTGLCLCSRGGWFSMYAGTCVTSLAFKLYTSSQLSEYSIETVDFGSASGYTSRNTNFTDTFGRSLFDGSGRFIYTPTSGTQAIAAWYDIDDGTGGVPVITAVPGDVFVLTLRHNGGVAYTGGPSYTRAKEIYATRWTNYAGSTTITTIPGITRSGYTFRGFYTSQLEDAEASTTSTSGFKMKTTLPSNTGISSDTTWYAAWAKNCAPGSHATCSLTIGSSGQVTYTTGCDSGYTIISGSGTYNPVCSNSSSVTITLNKNGGTGAIHSFTGTTSATWGCPLSNSTCDLPTWGNTCNITNGTKIFVGWATSSNATSGVYTINTPSSATTYYAVWKDTTCSVTNGTGSATTPSNNAPQCVVTCNTGYQTSGTYTGTAGNPTFSYTCNKNCYQISFDNTTNGGTGGTQNVWLYRNTSNLSDAKNCKIYSDSSCSTQITSITVPTKSNASFGGYYSTTSNNANNGAYYDEGWFGYDGTSQIAMGNNYCATTTDTNNYFNALVGTWGFNTSSTPSMTLRALYWCDTNYHEENGECVADTYTITLNANGGTIPSGGTTSVSATYGDAMPAIQTGNKLPTREYYTFAGYYDTSAATGGTMYYTAAGASARPWDKTSDTTLYARWTKVSYSLQLSKAPITECQFADKYYYYTPADGKWYSNAALTNEITTGGVNYDPSCSGYVFRGWYWNSPSGYNDPIGAGAVMTHNTTIAAGQNAPNSYQPYALNANNLTGKSLSSNAHLYARWAQNCATVANGSCSLNVEANGNVIYTDSCNSNYSLVENGVYNPVCSPVYTVSFNANGGSGSASPTSVTCVYDQDCTLAAKGTLAKSNATFDGWNTETDGSGNGYLESDTVQNLTSTAGATVVLYAVWRTSGCSAGQYLDDGACVPCPAGYSCAGGDALPVMCGTNKYSTGGAVNCSSCTGGLTTSPIADARYHDEAADCGRKLHIGAYEIRLKSIPSTGSLSSLVPSPALRFNYSGNASGRPDFYANMSTIASPMRVTTANNDGTGAISTTGSGDKFKTRYNNTNYYVCDDVTCVTE